MSFSVVWSDWKKVHRCDGLDAPAVRALVFGLHEFREAVDEHRRRE